MSLRFSHFISFGIIAFWAAMMFSLVADRIIPLQIERRSSLIDEEVLRVQWMDIHEWMTIKKNGNTIGAMGLTVLQQEPTYFPDGNGRFELNQNITLEQFGAKIRFSITAHMSAVFNLLSFAAEGTGLGLSGEAQGFVENQRLYYRFRYAGLSTRLDDNTPWNYGFLDLDQQALSLQGAVESMMSRNAVLGVGEKYSFETVNPFGGMKRQIAVVEIVERTTITLEGEPTASFRLETTIPTPGMGNVKRNTWVSMNGATLRTELTMGFMAERGNAARIIQTYPWLGEDATIPVFDRPAFIEQAVESQKNMPDAQSIQNMDFFQLLQP